MKTLTFWFNKILNMVCDRANIVARDKEVKRTKEERNKAREKDICLFNTALHYVLSSSQNVTLLSGNLPAQTDFNFKIRESRMEFQQPKHRLKTSRALNVCVELFICLCIRALHVRVRVNEYMNKILGEMMSECTYRMSSRSIWDQSGSPITIHTQRYTEQ